MDIGDAPRFKAFQSSRKMSPLSRPFSAFVLALVFLAPFLSVNPSSAYSTANPPTINSSGMRASMEAAYGWAVSRVLPNGTATLDGTSNNLLSTSLVGRVLTYEQLEIGNASTLSPIQKMVNAEHVLLQDPRYITFGNWPVQNLQTELSVHRDVQKFLSRAYGLTLNQTARSDFVRVTQDIYLNMPTKYEYFDTISWGLANAVWFAANNGSPFPPASDFTSAVQDLNLHYNLTAAEADSANQFVDFHRLLHYIVPIEFTDSYFRLEGNSLDQTYRNLETQLANQLLTRQMPNGNISSLLPYKAYLVEDYARDLNAVFYLNGDVAYPSSASKTESFIIQTYLQPSGNISLPGTGDGLDPIIAFHLVSIANNIETSSAGDWYLALSNASKIINYTISTQNQDGTFRFYTNSSDPGFAYTTLSGVSTIVDSFLMLCSSNLAGTNGCRSTPSSSVVTTSSSTTTASAGITAPGGSSGLVTSLPSVLPSWAYVLIPALLLIGVAMVYEARHRTRYRGTVDK